MKKTRMQLIVIFLLITSYFTFSVKISGLDYPLQEDLFTYNLLPKGSDTIGWTLEEILTDRAMSFSSFSGKVVLLDFFATWCGPCQTSMAELKEIKSHYSSSEVVVISMDTDPNQDSEEIIESFADEYGMNWYIFRDTEGISSFYQISSIPTFYIIDQDQKVYSSKVGVADASELINTIDKLIDDSSSNNQNTGDPIPEFWQNNWYCFLILPIFAIIGIAIVIQRQRAIQHNKKIRQQKLEEKKRKQRKRQRYR